MPGLFSNFLPLLILSSVEIDRAHGLLCGPVQNELSSSLFELHPFMGIIFPCSLISRRIEGLPPPFPCRRFFLMRLTSPLVFSAGSFFPPNAISPQRPDVFGNAPFSSAYLSRPTILSHPPLLSRIPSFALTFFTARSRFFFPSFPAVNFQLPSLWSSWWYEESSQRQHPKQA